MLLKQKTEVRFEDTDKFGKNFPRGYWRGS